MGIWISETWINATDKYNCGESEPYETWCETIGELYKAMQKEHGRCIGKMYIDTKNNGAKQTGWVFQKRQKYTDCAEIYLLETWVSVYAGKPELVKRHYNVVSYPFK